MLLAPLLALLFGPPASPSAPDPTIVLMVPNHPGEHDELILATVSAHLHEFEVTVVVERHEPSLDLRTLIPASHAAIDRSDARGILWIDVPARPGGDLGLYVVERDGQQIYGWTVGGGTPDALAIETLANVAAMAAVALSEGRAIQLDPGPPRAVPGVDGEPESTLEPEPAVEAELPTGMITREGEVEIVTRPWLRLRAGYRGNNFATTVPWQSSVTFAVGVHPTARSHVELIADVAIPSAVTLPELRIVLQRYPFAIAGGYQWPLRRGWDIEPSGRVTLEPTVRHAAASGSGTSVTTSPSSLRWFVSAEIDLAAGVRLAETVRLSVGLGLAVVLARQDYVIGLSDAMSSTQQVVISPHPVRMLLFTGFDFDLVWR